MTRRDYLKIKYLLDRIIGLFFLIIFFPLLLILFIILGILIKLDSKGPIFYKQKRIGLNNKYFYIYKFRTMYNDTNINTLSQYNQKKYKEHFKLKNDPRITKIGKYLRKYSIDEIPQLFNIIKGDMSFIGPRPIVDVEIDKYGKKRKKFLSVKPGLSGIWTCYSTKKTTYKERIEMELYYVDNVSFILDCKLLFKTFKLLLNKEREQIKNEKLIKNKI